MLFRILSGLMLSMCLIHTASAEWRELSDQQLESVYGQSAPPAATISLAQQIAQQATKRDSINQAFLQHMVPTVSGAGINQTLMQANTGMYAAALPSLAVLPVAAPLAVFPLLPVLGAVAQSQASPSSQNERTLDTTTYIERVELPLFTPAIPINNRLTMYGVQMLQGQIKVEFRP